MTVALSHPIEQRFLPMSMFGDSGVVRRCSIDGCSGRHYGRGYCRNHWYRWWRNGDPLVCKTGGRPKPEPDQHRLKAFAILEGYNASAREVAIILRIDHLTAARYAKQHGFKLRRDPPGQERLFSESRTHRQFVMRKYREKGNG